MNKKKIIMWACIGVIILMFLFPPTIQYTKSAEGIDVAPYYYYGFFFQVHDREIQIVKLLLQCVVAVLIAGGLIVTFEEKKEVIDEIT